MPIGPKILLELVREINLVESLSERELKNPEGAGFDLRLGEVYSIEGKGYLGIEERNTPKVNLVAKFKKSIKESVVIRAGEQYLVTTLESVNLPDDITANLWLRSTLYRSGIILSGGNIAPGYSGKLSFTFFNSGKSVVEIELGARIVHIMFFRVEGEGSRYRGQWQGGRVSAVKREKQV
jgi:deoxycytidine triphosphate deaminase